MSIQKKNPTLVEQHDSHRAPYVQLAEADLAACAHNFVSFTNTQPSSSV